MASTRTENRAERTEVAPAVVLVVMCVGYFLVLLDVTIVNVALPSIGDGLHTDVSSLQWVVDGYALALASLMLPAGTLGDRQVPITIAAIAATLRVVRADHGKRAGALDTAGALLGVLVLLAWTFAFIQGGRSGAGSPLVLGALGVAILLLAAFLLVEQRRGREAMLPLDLARRPPFALANISAGAMNLGTLGVLFVLTLFLQSVQHRTPLGAGLALIPLFAPLALIAPIGGRVVARIGPRLPIIAGFVLAAVGLALPALAHPASSYAAILLPAFLAWGIGLGILTPAVVAASVAATPGERAGLASAVNNTARQAGGAIGVAVAGAVAGSPDTSSFVSRLHTVAAGAAALFIVLALVNSLMKYQDSSTNSAEP